MKTTAYLLFVYLFPTMLMRVCVSDESAPRCTGGRLAPVGQRSLGAPYPPMLIRCSSAASGVHVGQVRAPQSWPSPPFPEPVPSAVYLQRVIDLKNEVRSATPANAATRPSPQTSFHNFT